MDMIQLSMLLHSLRMYKHGDEFIMDLIKAITELFKAYKGKITGRVVGNMVLGLKGMSSDREEVLSLVVEITRLVKTYKGNSLTDQKVTNNDDILITGQAKKYDDSLTDQAVSNMIYGLQGLSSVDHPVVLTLVAELTRLLKTYNGPITGQGVSNMIYGLQGFSSDHPVVLMLVAELTRLLKT